MDTIAENMMANGWGMNEAAAAGLEMPEMRFPELENAVEAREVSERDRVLSAGYDALVRGWDGDEGDEVRKQRREAAVEAFGDEWVQLYEQTDDGGRARVAGKRFLRDFCKVDGGDEYDALLAYKEAKGAGDVKDFGSMWRHFAAGRGKELADFEAKEKARREEGLALMMRVVRSGGRYEERAWVSDEEVEKWNEGMEKGEEETPKERVRGPWESYTDLTGMLGAEASVRERAKASGQMREDGRLRRRGEVEAELAERANEARNEAMDEFYAGKARGLFTEEEERSVRRAQAAYKLFDELTDDFTTAAFDVYAQPEAGRGIYGMLEGDEMAKALFFTAVKEKMGEMLGTERMRTRAERFARAFKAADVKLMGMPLVDGEFDESDEAASRFRAQLYQAVNGVYDTDGSVAAALGAMMPTSVSFLAPVAGPAVVFRQAQKEAYVNDLAEGVGFDAAMVRSVGSGAIETVVEGIAFGKMGKAFTPKWVDKVMQTPAMGRVLGKVYGSTAGRFGMSFGANMAEEVIGEPLAAAGLGYVWNALAPEAYELDDPWEGLKGEVGEMLKPENLGATALYGLLLGAVSAPGQAGEAKAYRETLEALKLAGVDEGRAGQIARMEDGVERMATASREGAMALSMAGDEKVAEVSKVLAEKYPGFGELVTFTRYYAEGKMPKLTEAGVDEEGRKVYEVEMAGKGSVRMSEGQARAFVESKLEDMVEEEQARLADAFLADRMVDALGRDKERWVTEDVADKGGMNRAYFARLAAAARVQLAAGRGRDEVVPEVHEHLTLGELERGERDWEARLKIARHDMERERGEAYTEEEWAAVKERLSSPANRTRLRREQKNGRRRRTLLRYARGLMSAMDVLEEVTEDNLVRYMEGMDVGLEWFVEQLRGLGGAMGDEYKFLRKLGEGESGYELLDVVEGIGKVVRGKVLADTAHRANGLPGWVQAFLDMLRRWVEEAGALMKLGAAVNEALHADADGARRLDEGFRGMVEELVAQDVEWLRGLQAEAGREAQGRVMAAGRSGVARVRGERPILQAAEAKQGEAVRREQEGQEGYERAADEEASAAMELAAGEQPGRVDAREMDLERGRELAGRFHAVEGGEAVVCRVEDGEYDGVREADIYAEDSKVARGALRRIVKALATEAVTFSDGTRATVSGRTRGEIQQHMADRRVIAALAKVRELAARGVYLYSAENSQSDVKASKQGIVGYHYYLAKGDFSAQGKGEAYVCIAVSEYVDGQRVYDIDLVDVAEVEQNKEEAQLLPAGRISAQDVSGEKEEGNPRRATRVTNTGLAGTPFKGRIHETKRYVNYIDRVSQEKGDGEVFGNSEQLSGNSEQLEGESSMSVADRGMLGKSWEKSEDGGLSSSMSVAEAREKGLFKDGVMEVSNGFIVDGGADFSASVDFMHVSQALYRRPDREHVGEGFGAQMFGWGVLYGVTNPKENRKIFDDATIKETLFVRKRDGREESVAGKEVLEELARRGVTDEDILRSLQNYSWMGSKSYYENERKGRIKDLNTEKEILERAKRANDAQRQKIAETNIAYYEQEVAALDYLIENDIYVREGGAKRYPVNYRMRADVDDGNVLHWDEDADKFINEHPDVAEAMNVAEAGEMEDAFGDAIKMRWGKNIYFFLAKKLGSARAASEWLDAHGIRGVKYRDDATYGQENGTYNYVIFNPDYIEVIAINNRHAWSEYSEDNPDWERPEDVVWEQDGDFSASVVFSPAERSGLRALRELANGAQEARFRSDTLGQDVVFPLGSAGELKDASNPKSRVVGAFGFIHLISMRMAHGESLEEACYTACKAVMAAVNGRVAKDVKGQQKELSLDGYRSIVRLTWQDEKKAWMVTGYKEDGENSKAGDRQRASSLAASYALDSFGGLKEVGAALDYGIARLAQEYKQNNADPSRKAAKRYYGDFSGSIRLLRDGGEMGRVTRGLEEAGRSFKKNEAFVQQMLGEMRKGVERMRRLAGKGRTKREEALAVMGGMVGMVKAVRLYLPKGFGFSVEPYVRQLEVLCELATTGRVELADPIKRVQKELATDAAGEGLHADAEWFAQEWADGKVGDVMGRVMGRVAEQLRRYAKREVMLRMEDLLGRMEVRRKNGRLVGGKMDAEGYREMGKVREALGMSEEELEAKLSGLEARLGKAEDEEERGKLEGEMALYSTFGNGRGMSMEGAAAAYEALRVWVGMNRFSWEEAQANQRVARREVVRKVVEALGKARVNEYHAARVRKKPAKEARSIGELLMSAPQTLLAMGRVPGLSELAEDLQRRVNRAGEMMKRWERERWGRLEALARHTLGRSWRGLMDELHGQGETGVAFERPIRKTVKVGTAYLRELQGMTKRERAEEFARNREAGGVMAELVFTEGDMAALSAELAKIEKEVASGKRRKVPKEVRVRYVAEVQHEEDLRMSRGEALYVILMYEQPTYTERMEEAAGWTPEVVEGLRRYVGEGWLAFGYGLREMFAEQGEKIAAIYERVYGVPFPREENYFAARFLVHGMQENSMEELLASMQGQPGVGNGWMKPRVLHSLEVDTNKDALQVFLQAVAVTDAWMATQDIVADMKAYLRDAEFSRALTVALGKDAFANLKGWVEVLERGGVQDTVNMGAAQNAVSRLYGAAAVSILGFRVQTWLRQVPAVLNGLLGAHDISTWEWLWAMARMKRGEARMTLRKMMASDFMRNRMPDAQGKMKEQAMRGEEKGSRLEPVLDAAMAPMGGIDAGLTGVSLVPVWNVYYDRARRAGMSEGEAEAEAWERTEVAANMGSQPIGFLNKSKVGQVRSVFARGMLFMLSEATNKVGLVTGLWQAGHKKAAARAWLMYGAANAMVSALLDCLQGDPEEFEEGKWWEYVLSAVYGPLASMPGVGEALEALGTQAIRLAGKAMDNETMSKAKMRASVGRALIDVSGTVRAIGKLYELMTDDEEHELTDYTRAASTIGRVSGTALGWMGNTVGYTAMLLSVMANPADFAARVYRNVKHYVGG